MLLALIAFGVFCYTQLTLFVVQPIGAVPDGVTLVIWRREKTNFIDSADAFCERQVGGVTMLCRGATLAAIARGAPGCCLPLRAAAYRRAGGRQ